MPELEEAYQELKHMSADEKTRQLYESRQTMLFDNASNLQAHLKEGEAKERKRIAKNLLKLNIPIEQISQASGLSVDEIKAL